MDIANIYRDYPHLRIGYGSVTGRLRAIPAGVDGSVRCRYQVTDPRTEWPVECIVPPELEKQAADAASEQRRVVMSGKLHRNEDGVKQKVEVRKIAVMPELHELPSLDELAGSLPNITDGLTTEEFMRIMRDDNAYYEYTAGQD